MRSSPLAERAVAIFEKARDSVAKGTWGQPYNNLPKSDSPRSVHGHMGAALHAYYEKHGQMYGMGLFCREILMELTNGNYDKWNDAPNRTKDEVVALLDQAAGLARELSWEPSHHSSKQTSSVR